MKRILILAFIFLIASQSPASAAVTLPDVATYDQLIHAIRETKTASQARIEQVVAQEKVREAWEIGKLINEHILQHKERANYGEQVVKRLSGDLGMSHTELKYMIQFARTYPIGQPADQLSWAHYIELLSLNDDQERQEVAMQAVREHWTRNQVREEVQRHKNRNTSLIPIEKLEVGPGEPGIYQVIKIEAGPDKGKLAVDLGFSNYYLLTDKETFFKVGDIIKPSENTPERLTLYAVQDADLYTYKAHITQVIDGDTVDALVDLGFGILTKQKLRFRGLDAPEIESAEGREAKTFLEKRFAQAGNSVLIKTTRSDKYDRYLVDVFLPQTTGSEESYTSLNQELLEQGLASPVKV